MQFPKVLLLTSSFPPIQLEEEKDEDSFDMEVAVTNPEKIGKEYFFLTIFELMFSNHFRSIGRVFCGWVHGSYDVIISSSSQLSWVFKVGSQDGIAGWGSVFLLVQATLRVRSLILAINIARTNYSFSYTWQVESFVFVNLNGKNTTKTTEDGISKPHRSRQAC